MEKKIVKKKKTNKKTNLKQYNVKKNNYKVIILLVIMLIAASYFIKEKFTKPTLGLEPVYNSIIPLQNGEITEENELIKKLSSIPNGGDPNTYKIYQSMYTTESVTIDSLDIEDILHITYRYIDSNIDLSPYNQYLTCDIAKKANIEKNIIQCGGNKYSITSYQYNTLITKELLHDTAEQIFNVNLTEYTNFYTKEGNLCYFIDNEFICISKKLENNDDTYGKQFIKATVYDNKIEIIEDYYYIKNNTKYSFFKSKEEGSTIYVSTFRKTNGSYHWVETKPYKN